MVSQFIHVHTGNWLQCCASLCSAAAVTALFIPDQNAGGGRQREAIVELATAPPTGGGSAARAANIDFRFHFLLMILSSEASFLARSSGETLLRSKGCDCLAGDEATAHWKLRELSRNALTYFYVFMSCVGSRFLLEVAPHALFFNLNFVCLSVTSSLRLWILFTWTWSLWTGSVIHAWQAMLKYMCIVEYLSDILRLSPISLSELTY